MYDPMPVFDSRPVALHGRDEFGWSAGRASKLRIPDPKTEEWCILPAITPLPGYTEVKKNIYEYPEMTGAIMKPPALTNHQVARVSAKTYEIEGPMVKARLAGLPPVQFNRQWDQSYYRYEY